MSDQFNGISFKGMSADQLQAIAKKATELAADLKKKQPTYELAIAAGVRDKSYNTVRYGWISSYGGEAEVTMADGSRWRCVGHSPRGSAEWVSREGFIEFIPIE